MPRKTLGSILSNEYAESGGTASSQAATPGATVAIDASTGGVWTWTAGQNETVNVSNVQSAGNRLLFIITNDGTLPRVITLGTGLVGIGTITGVLSKKAIVEFVSDGTTYYEIARTVGI